MKNNRAFALQGVCIQRLWPLVPSQSMDNRKQLICHAIQATPPPKIQMEMQIAFMDMKIRNIGHVYLGLENRITRGKSFHMQATEHIPKEPPRIVPHFPSFPPCFSLFPPGSPVFPSLFARRHFPHFPLFAPSAKRPSSDGVDSPSVTEQISFGDRHSFGDIDHWCTLLPKRELAYLTHTAMAMQMAAGLGDCKHLGRL